VTSADKKGTTSRQVAEITRLGCHTPDRTNGKFDYPELRLAILAPGHGACALGRWRPGDARSPQSAGSPI